MIGRSGPPIYDMCPVLSSARFNVNSAVHKRIGRAEPLHLGPLTVELTGIEIGRVTPIRASESLSGDQRPDHGPREPHHRQVRGERKPLVPPATLASHPNVPVIEDLAMSVPSE